MKLGFFFFFLIIKSIVIGKSSQKKKFNEYLTITYKNDNLICKLSKR